MSSGRHPISPRDCKALLIRIRSLLPKVRGSSLVNCLSLRTSAQETSRVSQGQ